MTQQEISSADWVKGDGADDAPLRKEACPNCATHKDMLLKLRVAESNHKGITRTAEWQCMMRHCQFRLSFSRTIPHKKESAPPG